MKMKKGLLRMFVICAVMCLCAQASAIDDPNDLPEVFDQTRQGVCCSSLDLQETGDGGIELAE
jgi:hypothetical protein